MYKKELIEIFEKMLIEIRDSYNIIEPIKNPIVLNNVLFDNLKEQLRFKINNDRGEYLESDQIQVLTQSGYLTFRKDRVPEIREQIKKLQKELKDLQNDR